MSSAEKAMELGFAEKTDSWRLRSKFFPSKLGGKPAWLALKNLPKDLSCKCGEPMTFIMQVYAPLDDAPSAFHRTLFVFGCQPCVDKKKPNSIVVYRSQLGLKNEFYADQPAVEVEKNSNSPSAKDFHELCCVCGCPGSLRCSLCKVRNYCSKQHQTIDWKKAHKAICAGKKKEEAEAVVGRDEIQDAKVDEKVAEETQEKSQEGSGDFLSNASISWGKVEAKTEPPKDVKKESGAKVKPKVDHEHKGILPEFDIETEPEEIDESAHQKKEDTAEDLAKYLKGMGKESIASMKEMGSCSERDLKEIEDISKGLNDKAFNKFKKVIDPYPDQILRFCRGGKPVWVSAEGLPKEIPDCPTCGTRRIFECQIMPQTLNLLKNELLDWGVLAIYTCEESCDSDEYVKELVFRQDFT